MLTLFERLTAEQLPFYLELMRHLAARLVWGVCEGDTLTDEPWIELARVLGRRWPGETCVPLGFDRFAIDSGGGKGRTARVYAFVARSARVVAIKGSSDSNAQPYSEGHIQRAKTRAGAYAQARVDLIGGHDVKHTIMGMLNRGADAKDAGALLDAALYYTPESMVGRTIVIVANLKPAKIRGIESQGMLLAAKIGNELKLITVDGEIASGASVG